MLIPVFVDVQNLHSLSIQILWKKYKKANEGAVLNQYPCRDPKSENHLFSNFPLFNFQKWITIFKKGNEKLHLKYKTGVK